MSTDLDAYRHWLIQQGAAPGTITTRLTHIREFAKLHPNLYQVQSGHLAAFLTAHRKVWSAEYRKSWRASFTRSYGWAYETGRIDTNPAANLPGVPTPRGLPHPVPHDVVLQGFITGSLRQKAPLALGALLGLRRQEIAECHPHDRHGQILHVRGKGAKDRDLPIDDTTLHLLLELEQIQGTSTWYFPGRFSGHVYPTTIYKWIRACIGDWSTHSLRHHAATEWIRDGASLRVVQELLGHSSLATTQIYTKVTLEQMRTAVVATAARFATEVKHLEDGISPTTDSKVVVLDLNHVTLAQAQLVFNAAMHAQGVDTDRAGERS